MRHESCDRARRWVSVALDEGLSDLEGRLLDTHLSRCDECRAFERRVCAVTRELRHAELVSLERPIALPHRQRRLSGFRIASASAAAAAVGVFGVFALATSGEQVRPALNVQDTEAFDVRQARRAQMVSPRPAPQFTHVQMARGDKI